MPCCRQLHLPKGLSRGGYGFLDVLLGMGGAEEGGFELRGGSQMPASSMARKKLPNVVVSLVAAVPVGDFLVGEEEREHGADAIDGHRDAGFPGGGEDGFAELGR